MEYAEWEHLYDEILKDFGFSRMADEEAARLLDKFSPSGSSILTDKIEGKNVNVYGAGRSLDALASIPSGVNISANGATSFLLERGTTPDVVVTDLDGRIEDLLRANEQGSIVVIHAHGDNIDAIEKYAGRFKNWVATTQSKPFGSVYNFGGFTDGDRAVFLAEHFGARSITLYGMDFIGIGKYSFSEYSDVKKKKLIWGKRLVDYLRKKSKIVIVEGAHG